MKRSGKYGSTEPQLKNPLLHRLEKERRNARGRFSIFVVDDDPMFLYALSFRLKKDTHWDVYCYATPEECLDRMDQNPDVVVLDYFFVSEEEHHINGLEALKAMLELKPGLPVIILSSQRNFGTSLELLRAGAYSYVMKDKTAVSTIESMLVDLRREKMRLQATRH